MLSRRKSASARPADRLSLSAFSAPPVRPSGLRFVTVSIVVVFVALCVLLFDLVGRALQDARREVDAAAVTKATLVARSYGSYLAERTSTSDILSRTVAFEFRSSRGALDLNYLVQEGLVLPSDETLLTLVNAQGLVTQSWPTPPKRAVYLSDREHFIVQKNAHDDNLFIGAPVLGRVSRAKTIQFTRRLSLRDQSFDGIVVVSQPPQYFTASFANHSNLGNDGEILVFRSDGSLLVRGRADGSVSTDGLPLSMYPAEAGGTKPQRDPIDGQRRLFVRQAVPGYALIAVVALSEADIYANYERQARLYWAWTLVVVIALVLVAALAMFNARRVLYDRARNKQLAETDLLTGLGNRRAIETFLAQLPEAEAAQSISLILIDVTDFGAINRRYGDDGGDNFLAAFATRIRAVAQDSDLIARIKGDQFAILFAGQEPHARALYCLRTITDAFNQQPILFHGHTHRVTMSIGFASASVEAARTGDLQARAELALQLAKRETAATHGTRYKAFAQSMLDSQEEARELEFDLDNAVRQREGIAADCAPVVCPASGVARGVWVTPVWRRAELPTLRADAFMPVAEKQGLAVFVWMQTIESARAAIAPVAQPTTIYLRLPAQILTDPLFSADVFAGAPPSASFVIAVFGVEQLPERDVLHDVIGQLRAQAVRVLLALDPADGVPLCLTDTSAIDGLLVEGEGVAALPASELACGVASGMFDAGSRLGWRVVVGGVATREQFEWLAAWPALEVFGPFVERHHELRPEPAGPGAA
jgi:diguanylate cyclase (GGDEF)-like protein